MSAFNKNQVRDIKGDYNQVIQIILTGGGKVEERLGDLIERLVGKEKVAIETLQQLVAAKEATIKDKSQINQLLDAQLLQLKIQLHQKEEALEASEQRLATIFLENNGKDFSGSAELYAKAVEALTNGDKEGALKLLDRHQLLEQKQQLDQEKEQQANAWLLRAQLLQEEDNWGEELDECYDMVVELFPSWRNCLDAGRHFQFINSFDKAIVYLNLCMHKAISKEEQALILNNLAIFHYDTNQFNKAEDEFLLALQIYRNLATEASLPHLALILTHLATLYSKKNQFDKAEDTLIEALEIYQTLETNTPNAFFPENIKAMDNLATLFYQKERFAEAEQIYLNTLGIRKELAIHDPSTFLPEVADTLNRIAVLYHHTNEFEEAENHYLDALSIQRALAINNPNTFLSDVADTLNNLANLYLIINVLAEAEKVLLEALEIKQQLVRTTQPYDSFSPDIAMILSNLAHLYTCIDEFNKAEQEYLNVLKIRQGLALKAPKVFELPLADTYLKLNVFYRNNKVDLVQAKEYATKALLLYQKYEAQVPYAKEQVKALQAILENPWSKESSFSFTRIALPLFSLLLVLYLLYRFLV